MNLMIFSPQLAYALGKILRGSWKFGLAPQAGEVGGQRPLNSEKIDMFSAKSIIYLGHVI